MKLLYRPAVAHAVAATAAVALIAYLGWRATATLNPSALAFASALLVAEIQGAIGFLLGVFTTWRIDQPAAPAPPPNLTVDVFVPTFDEDLDVLEATLIGCGAMTYPHQTYVLDDGHRPAVAMLAARLGCHYLTRPNNHHGKAGNLNAALVRTTGQVIAIVDADTVPQPDLLDRTLGYFADERVGLVQLPEEFYNLDSVQHESDAGDGQPWHDQTLFYRVIQPGKNRLNAVIWCGGASVVRRAALESIGGVATDSIASDLQTSIRLHRAGWRTIYHPEALAYTIAPPTFHAFNRQRIRQAQGAMQVLRSRDNPLIAPGLSPGQRLSYLGTIWDYFDGARKLIYLVTPAVILVTGTAPVAVGAIPLVARWLPVFLLTTLASCALGRGSYRVVRIEKYRYLKMFSFLRAMLTLVGLDRPYRQSQPADGLRDAFDEEPQVPMPQVAALALVTASGVVGIASFPWGANLLATGPSLGLLALGWTFLNVVLLGLAVSTIVRRSNRRHSYRFPIQLDAALAIGSGQRTPAQVWDISLYGVGLIAPSAVELGHPVAVSIDLPGGPLTIHGEVVHCRALTNGQFRLGVQFVLFDALDRARLMAFLFIVGPRYQRVRETIAGSARPTAPRGATGRGGPPSLRHHRPLMASARLAPRIGQGGSHPIGAAPPAVFPSSSPPGGR